MADLAPPPGPPANRGPFARRLALKLVEDALGPVCARVIKVLVDHGTQQVHGKPGQHAHGWAAPSLDAACAGALRAAALPTPLSLPRLSPPPSSWPAAQYGELARASGMPPLQLRAGLLVLVQHNYVDVYLKREPPTLRGPGPSYPLYAAALPRILQSLRCEAGGRGGVGRRRRRGQGGAAGRLHCSRGCAGSPRP